MRKTLLAFAVALAVVAAGCGNDAADPGETVTDTDPCVDLTGAGPTATIVQRDNVFDPDCVIVSADQGLSLTNEGAALHNFRVPDTDLDLDTAAGEETSTEPIGQALEPGTYAFDCKYHLPEMAGEITVQ